MAQAGVALKPDTFSGAPSVCQQVIRGDRFANFASYDEFARTARVARLVFDGLIRSMERAEQHVAPQYNRDLFDEINYFELRAVLLSNAGTWGVTEFFNPERRPQMTRDERMVFFALYESENVRFRFAESRWLEDIVERHGWPTSSNTSRRGASNAALRVLYGAHDPAFQIRMLRLIEPLVAKGAVEQYVFAELYDGVMLELTDKQRYGTHIICTDGLRGPQVLEDPDRLNVWRAEMGLGPIEDYAQHIRIECSY